MSQTFDQYVLSTYGKSVYQIRLEIAEGKFAALLLTNSTQRDAQAAWLCAEIFIAEMRRQWQSQPEPPCASTHPGSLASAAFRPGLESVEPTG